MSKPESVDQATQGLATTTDADLVEASGVDTSKLTRVQAVVNWFAWAFLIILASLIVGCFTYVCVRLPHPPRLDASTEQIDAYKDLCVNSIEDAEKLFNAVGGPVVTLLTLCVGYFAGKRED